MTIDTDGPQRRYVRASDRRLAELAAQAAARVDIEALQYRRTVSTGVVTERSFDGTIVTATNIVECSLAEMRGILASPTNDRYTNVMRELFGQDFIYGAIVHHAEEITTEDVTVRTATFLKRHLLARNEQWCFVTALNTPEALNNNDTKGFTVAMTSLHPDDVFTGKAQAVNVTHIQGLSVLYLVTAEPQRAMKKGRAKQAVRVTFCAHVTTSPSIVKASPFRWFALTGNREEADDASDGTVVARVGQLANTLKQFQAAVRLRRLDAQVLADLRKVRPSNSRCACCTRRIGVIKSLFSMAKGETSSRGSKRCQLCGFLVCARCVCTIGKSLNMSEPSASGIKYSQSVHLCEHCMQRVDDADYDNYCASNGSLSPLSLQPDGPDAEPPSAVIARALSQVLGNASRDEKPVVIRVIKHLLSPKQEYNKFCANSVALATSLGHLAKDYGFSKEIPNLEVKQVPEYTPEAPKTNDVPPIADASGRKYALQYADLLDDDAATVAAEEDAEDTEDVEDTEDGEDVDKVVNIARHPVPPDENQRLQWIDNHPNIVSHMMDFPDLELLCNIARQELKCDATLVTIIDPNVVHIVASTDPSWRGLQIPRDHAICNHALMNQEPLLVRFPEADVRFSAVDIVRRVGVRFYLGFPIKISYPDYGGSIAVGTFCCVHTSGTRDVSESQYALMATLVEGVISVMESRASCLLEN